MQRANVVLVDLHFDFFAELFCPAHFVHCRYVYKYIQRRHIHESYVHAVVVKRKIHKLMKSAATVPARMRSIACTPCSTLYRLLSSFPR